MQWSGSKQAASHCLNHWTLFWLTRNAFFVNTLDAKGLIYNIKRICLWTKMYLPNCDSVLLLCIMSLQYFVAYHPRTFLWQEITKTCWLILLVCIFNLIKISCNIVSTLSINQAYFGLFSTTRLHFSQVEGSSHHLNLSQEVGCGWLWVRKISLVHWLVTGN